MIHCRRFPTEARDMIDLTATYERLTSHACQSWYAIPLRLIVGFGFMEHGYAKVARGPEKYASILHCAGCACSRPPGLGDDSRRVVGRASCASRRLHPASEHTDGDRAARGDLHCAFAERVQLYQAAVGGCRRGALRSARLRDSSALSGGACFPRPWRLRSASVGPISAGSTKKPMR